MTDAGPQIAGRYEILREIGRGGMAIVYAARQPDLDRQVALKELSRFHAGSVEFAHRFLRESRLAGSLNHPNIVTVYEYFEHDRTPYIAMEYVPRGSLRRYMKGMTLPQIAGVLEGVLAGLAHAETAGIVHRDLKPENIMVAGDGRVKITDFGIARATQSAGTAYVTATGMTVGTPTYMAPEQAMAADIGPWTDLYSAGVLAYELLVGHVPFHDTDAPMVILMRHVNERIASPIEERPDIDSQLSQWVDSLLVKDPAKRVRHAPTAWESLEDIIVGLLGPMWRRNARLLDDQLAVRESDPLTPAPFESQSSIRTPTPESSKAAEVFVTFDPTLAAAPETEQETAPVAGPEAGPEAVPGAAAEVVPPAAADAPAPDSAGGASEEDSGTDGFVTFGRPVAAPEPVPQAPAPVPPPPETAPAAPGTAPATPDLTEAPVPVVPVPEAEPPPSRPEPMPPPVLTPEPMATPPPAPEPEAAEPEPEPEPEPERESEPVAAAMAAPAAQTAASDGRAQRSLAPLAVLVVILAAAAAAAGFVVAPSSTKQANSPAPLSGAGAAGPVTISYPAGWRRSPTVPAPASALKLTNPLALLPGQAARGGAFVIGIAPRVGPTLLPRTLTSSLKTAPSGSVVRIGSLGYRRYLGIVPSGASGPEIVYALPTSLGTVIAVCAAPSVNPPAFAAQCERVLGTMALSTGKVLPLSGNPGYAKELSSIINRLSAARNKDGRGLAIAKTQKAQAAAAQKVSADVSRAAAAVARLSPGPIGATGNAAVAAALRRIAAGYAALAVAAAHNQGSAYRQARSSISAGDSALRGAFAQLKQAGYKAG